MKMKGAVRQAIAITTRVGLGLKKSYGSNEGCLSNRIHHHTVGNSRGFVSQNVEFGPKMCSAPIALLPRVVIYDGVCHLCNRGIMWVIKADKHKKIRFCAVQSKAAEPYLIACGLDREDVLRRFLFVEGPGLCHQASTAALKVLSYLPLPYSGLSSLLLIPAPIRDAIYDYVAARRYDWFGKSEECIIPDSEVLERFIDREEMLQRQNTRF